MRVVCIGGGPGGLSFALLLKAARPDADIIVYERNKAGATFGFGVVFSDSTVDSLKEGDPVVYNAINDSAVHWQDIMVEVRGRSIRCGGNGFSAFARVALLEVLQRRAVELGIDVRYGSDVTDIEAAIAGADLVVASDGVNSTMRTRSAAKFNPRIDRGAAKFIWFGTRRRFDCLSFVFVENEHGVFATHAYPYDATMNTFIVETDEDAWRRAGLDVVDSAQVDSQQGDLRSKAYCERLFTDLLDGEPLVGNGSRWGTFPTVSTSVWRDGNTVLIGDAAHTAHFSVGSGTKMAMEDAIALAQAVIGHSSIGAALEAYEIQRRKAVERVQRAAWPSIRWWEEMRRYVDGPLERFAFHFLTRNDRMTRAALSRRDPAFVEKVDAWWIGTAESRERPQPAPDALRVDAEDFAALTAPDLAARAADAAASGVCDVVVPIPPTQAGRGQAMYVADLLAHAAPLRTFLAGEVDEDFAQTLRIAGRARNVVPDLRVDLTNRS